MELFDSHCHLDLEAFDDDRAEVVEAARAAGVTGMLLPGVQRKSWPSLVALCATDPHLHLALGLHPAFLSSHDDGDVEALASEVDRSKPVAIGEIGLDWYVRELDHDDQQRLLEAQLEVAQQAGLPVVLHVRKAHEPMLVTLRKYDLPGGFCHAFNGSVQQASRYIDMGFKLGFGGMVTFERSTRLRKLATELPLDSMVLETDAPDLPGAAHQYQRNSPAYLPEVRDTLASLRGEKPETIARMTTANARQVLGLGDDAAVPS